MANHILPRKQKKTTVCELVKSLYSGGEEITSRIGCAGFTWRKKPFPGHSWKGQVQAENSWKGQFKA